MKNKKKVAEVELSLYQRRKLAKKRKADKEVRDARKARKLKELKAATKKPPIAKNKKPNKKGPDKAKIVRPTKIKKPAKPKRVKAKPEVIEEVVATPVVNINAVVPKKVNYLNNRDLLAEVKTSKLKGEMTDKLARMLVLLCAKYAKKGNFINYTYNDDMQGYAIMMLVRTWNSFDPARSENAFAFYTQCIKSSFIQFLNQEKRQRNIKDMLLVDHGMNPSFAYEGEGTDQHILEDEQDFYAQKRAADALNRLPGEQENAEGPGEPVDEPPPEPDNHSSEVQTK